MLSNSSNRLPELAGLLLVALLVVGGVLAFSRGDPSNHRSLVPDWLSGQDGQDRGGGTDLAVGDVAPDFSLPAVGGQTLALSDFEGRNLLLYFSMGHG